MGEPFQGRERLFVFESQDTFMRLNTIEVEGDDPIEEGLICRKVLSMLRLIVQGLFDRASRLRHYFSSFLSRSRSCFANRETTSTMVSPVRAAITFKSLR